MPDTRERHDRVGVTLGVGIVGAGPVTQAIHLPVLATVKDRLHVAHVMDVDPAVAAAVAARADARWTTDVDALLADPQVDVVVICSPHRFHAEQVEAACAAGKRAILCEKPLAVDDDGADRIVAASRSSGVPVVVGTMHVYDPAVIAAASDWGGLAETARLVRSVIVLPPNERFVDLATEMHTPPGGDPAPLADAAMITDGILSLATHNLPLIRRFAPAVDNVMAATAIRPWGYDITFRSGECTVQLLAAQHRHWRPDWTLEVWGPGNELRMEFPPSYVLAGSATTTVRTGGGERRRHFGENGYQVEWRHLADLAEGRAEPAVSVEDAADDLRYALAIAAAATNRTREAA
jgi:predicted dehydrogenase